MILMKWYSLKKLFERHMIEAFFWSKEIMIFIVVANTNKLNDIYI